MQTRLTELVARYHQAQQQGRPLTPEELCRDCPELLDALKQRLHEQGTLPQAPSGGERTITFEEPQAHLRLDVSAEPVPGYHLVRRLGGGGFGEVWEALAPGGFRVAFKFVLLRGMAATLELRALDIIRSVRHPNLLTIFGTWQTARWLVIGMELAERTLQQRFDEAVAQQQPGIPRRELLRCTQDAARALDYLNKPRHFLGGPRPVGIQHGDVKPPNLLLIGDGLKVGDFGLVRLVEQHLVEHEGALTPAYAAPEVLDGHLSHWSDQYALAMSWCQLRGGRLPFAGTDRTGPPDLSMLPEEERPAVERALAREPRQRWPTCRDFVRALSMARGPLEMPVVAAPAPVLLPAPEATAGFRAPGPAGGAPPPAPSRQAAGPLCLLGHTEPVWSVAFSSDGKLALSAALDGTVRLWDVRTGSTLQRFAQHREGVTGAILVPGGREVLSAGLDGKVRHWNAASGQELLCFDRHQGRVLGVACSRDGRLALSGGEDQTLRLWDVQNGRELHCLQGAEDWITSVAISPDGRRLLAGSDDRTARLWDAQTGQELRCFRGHTGAVKSVAFFPDGRSVLSGSADQTVRCWDVQSGRERWCFRGHDDWVRSVAVSHDGRLVVTAGDDETLRLLRPDNGEELHRLEGPLASFLCAAFAPDGRQVLSGSDDGVVRVWQLP